LTTSGAAQEVARAYDDHANSFITKPVDFPRFTQALEAIRNYWFEVVTLPPSGASQGMSTGDKPRLSLPVPSQQQTLGVVLLSDDPRTTREVRELSEALAARIILTSVESHSGWQERLASVRCDVVLVDLAIGGDGVDAYRRARTAVPNAAIIALVSGVGATGELALREGADDYLDKSELDRASLSHALRSALRCRQFAERLRRAQRMQAIGQLASGIAHDFNNLLTVFHGHAELLAEVTTDARARESVQGIADATERAAQLTRQLLAFSQHQAVQLETIDLNRAVSDFSKTLRRVLGADVRLELQLAARPPFALADIGLIEQLLLNLAIDAREAMPAGGELVLETGGMTLEAGGLSHPEARAGAFSTLMVRDTRAHVERSDGELGELGGAGAAASLDADASLAPTVVRGIVQQHHGWIQIDSAPGVGRSVEIFLPRAQPERATAHAKETAPAERGTETILLVEDESPVRQMAKAMLGRHGYQVLEARSGPDAITRFEESSRPVNLLLTDIVMPGGMTGRELADELSRRDPRLAVVYTSGYGRTAVASDWVLNEGVNFLPKPYSAGRLLGVIRRALDAAHQPSSPPSIPEPLETE
ncbi:MAG TPA: response regulator, partial [Polyangiaceae bacterium]|nr:response regulator [Polyangiaceae bacterium]